MAINVSVQYNGRLLPDIILLFYRSNVTTIEIFSPIDYGNKWPVFLKTNGHSNLPGTASNNFIIQNIYKSSDGGRNLRLIICHERCLL